MLIKPITARCVRSAHAPSVVVPSFDALSDADKERLRRENQLTFLHAMHDPGGDFGGAIRRSAAGLESLLDAGAFGEELQSALFVYRMTHERGTQTGVVCGIPAASFAEGGEVLPHEAVQPELVSYLVRYLEELGVASSPVKATFRASDAIDQLIARLVEERPLLDFGDASDLQQEVWAVTDPEHVAAVVDAFASVGRAYVTDGHHRSAAALRLGRHTLVLTVLFPDEHLSITQFNRIALDVPLDALDRWLGSVGARRLTSRPGSLEQGTVGVFTRDAWHVAELPHVELGPPTSLDPAVLQDHVLGPVLGISDPGSDDRLRFVPGTVPLDELEARAAGGVAFALAPVSVSDVMEVADRGLAMPAKSTYFEPKARSGIFLMRY